MRIISGKFKSRKLKTPDPKHTRPTTDKNRGAIFNMLANRINLDNIGVCDIYSGSGALGLEALSRGAEFVHFVENNFGVVKILKENISALGIENQCRIFKMPAMRFSSNPGNKKYDLIIADPPFFKYDVYEVIANLLKNDFLNEGGIIIVERSKQTAERDIKNFGIQPLKKLGDSFLYEFVNS